MSKLTKEQKELFEKLTKLQKGVALATLEGKSPAEAHKLAGGKCNNESQRKDLGCQILLNPSVREFIDSVRSPIEQEAAQKAIATFEEKLALLWQGANLSMVPSGDDGKIDVRSMVAAVSEMNKMQGDHAAQRVDLGATEDLVHLIQQGRARALNNDSDN